MIERHRRQLREAQHVLGLVAIVTLAACGGSSRPSAVETGLTSSTSGTFESSTATAGSTETLVQTTSSTKLPTATDASGGTGGTGGAATAPSARATAATTTKASTNSTAPPGTGTGVASTGAATTGRSTTTSHSNTTANVVATSTATAARGTSTSAPGSGPPTSLAVESLRKLAGDWGGDGVNLRLDTGLHFEFDCAHAEATFTSGVNASGQYEATGAFIREHGGPIRVDEKADAVGLRVIGVVTNNTMRIELRLADQAATVLKFTLTQNSAGRLTKCL